MAAAAASAGVQAAAVAPAALAAVLGVVRSQERLLRQVSGQARWEAAEKLLRSCLEGGGKLIQADACDEKLMRSCREADEKLTRS